MKNSKILCLVCKNITISFRGSFEVCPICFWEDEGEIKNPDVATGGPNGDLSLNKAIENYKKFGVVEKRFLEFNH